ncbi:hypothetical protein HYP06_gp096 [Vibrio phage vB_VspP_pVa5]|uniref:Uncharacterized protein n=1 Tax=Vibrio phage vB_VspP_pVa5 TaxID=1913109 RepID=A0A1J0GV85_9CAUD|nr:hypothetical protein HYP06_gp096 [Vibrio phage vB_VspP_pVa5]APC46083.1 hypothetical protein vBVspPpVa5_0077 [Vibrio phage vB_VspP_pVa5]
MQYELWQDIGDDRYCVVIDTKFMWLDTKPNSLSYELHHWSMADWDDSIEEFRAALKKISVDTLVWVGEYDTFAEVYHHYEMEHLLNA